MKCACSAAPRDSRDGLLSGGGTGGQSPPRDHRSKARDRGSADQRPAEGLDAQTWLRLNRAGFGGIENGLHQRLDVSYDDDRCRVQNPKAMLVLGIFRRLAIASLWNGALAKPNPST